MYFAINGVYKVSTNVAFRFTVAGILPTPTQQNYSIIGNGWIGKVDVPATIRVTEGSVLQFFTTSILDNTDIGGTSAIFSYVF